MTAADDKAPDTHAAAYGRAGDRNGEGLTVGSLPTASLARLGLGSGSPATIRGHQGTLVALMDTGQVFGHALWWEERPGFAITVQVHDPIDVATLIRIAEDVRSVDATTWHRLTIETDLAGQGRVAPDMTRQPVLAGTLGSDPWTLTALVPAGYPLGPEDQRLACAELLFKGEHSDGNSNSCAGPNWAITGGVIFVFGEVDSAVRRVTITSTGLNVTVDTAAATSFPKSRFYATAAPDKACDVAVSNPDAAGPHSGMGLGEIGPLQGQAGYTPCFGARPIGPPTTVPPTTA